MEEDCSRGTSAGAADSPAKPQQQRPPLFQPASSQGKSRLQRSCRQAVEEAMRQEALRKEEETRRVAAVRQTKLKEKNKRAQQRFRERQRAKLDATEGQVHALECQLTQAEDCAQQATERAEAAEDRCRTLERLLAAKRDAEPSTSPVQAPAVPLLFEPYGGFDKLPEGDFVMVLKATQKIVLYVTKQQITASPLSWFIHIWKNCAQAVAVALVATRGDLESEAGKHLQGLMYEMTAFVTWTREANPAIVGELYESKLDESVSLQRLTEAQQLNMLREIGLTEEQRQHMIAARRFCLDTLNNLRQERLSLCKTLQDVNSDTATWGMICSSHAHMIELSELTARTVRAQSAAFYSFMNSVALRVLNPVQLASIVVQSYPYIINIMSLATLLAEDAGERPQQEQPCITLPDTPPLGCAPPRRSPMQPAGEHESCSQTISTALDRLWSDIFLA